MDQRENTARFETSMLSKTESIFLKAIQPGHSFTTFHKSKEKETLLNLPK